MRRVALGLGRQSVAELRDVQFGQSLDYPTVDVNVDREKAGLIGVRMSDVSRSLVIATSSRRPVAGRDTSGS